MTNKGGASFAKMSMVFVFVNVMLVLSGLLFLFGVLPIEEILFYMRFLDLNQLNMFKWELIGILIVGFVWVGLFKKFPKIMLTIMICWGIFLGYIYLFPLFQRTDETILFSKNYIVPEVKAHQKKNIVIIFWESMEDTFADAETWGENLIPHMSEEESKSTTFKGYHDLKITRSTIKSQVATFCGIPLLIKGQVESFLPKARCITDVLKEHGYYQVFMKAADTRYTNADVFAQNHSFDEVIGRQDFLKKGEITDEQIKGWGIWDSVFMNLAKTKLQALAQKNRPFSLILTTVNTHYPRGNTEKDCLVKYKDIRDNVKCSDNILYDFVKWFKTQEFSKDTLLLVMGDHPMFINLEMSISPILYRYKDREVFNMLMNGKSKTIHKKYVQFDWAPTILEEIGFTLTPRRFGLGTSLSSTEKSIVEKYGQEQLEEMMKNSKIDFKDRFVE